MEWTGKAFFGMERVLVSVPNDREIDWAAIFVFGSCLSESCELANKV